MSNLELHIFDTSNKHIVSNYNISKYNSNNNTLSFQLQDELRTLGFISGEFNIKINLLDKFIGSQQGLKINIDEISNNRKELRLIIPKKYLQFETYINEISTFAELETIWKTTTTTQNLVLNLFNNILIQIINIEQDNQTFSDYPYSIIVKLKNALPANITIDNELIISVPVITQYNQLVKLIPTNSQTTLNIITNPNFDINIDTSNKQDISFYSWDDLVTTGSVISSKLENNFYNFRQGSVDLNIDFTDYSNFVFYSSAENRLSNFKYKLTKIEQFEEAQIAVSQSIYKTQYDTKINQIKTEFDYYDTFLYTVSSSYSWPKDNDNIPLSVTSSVATTWYDGQLEIATDFDNININKLTKTLPTTVLEDDTNRVFITFIDMISQHFDFLYFYIQHLDYLRIQSENIESGLSNDLIYYVLKSYGWKPIHDTQYDDLSTYTLGVTGSVEQNVNYIDVVDENLPTSNVNKEIWNRIFNNLSYIYKTKGTSESIRALINCYGIPETILPILEFGGPKKTEEISKLIKYKFNYSLDFPGNGEYVTVKYYQPGTIEFRFKLDSQTTQTIFKRTDGLAYIKFEYISDNAGKVRYYTSTGINYLSDAVDIFNGEWWQFALRHNETTFVPSNTNTYDIRLLQKKYNNIITDYSGSFSTAVTAQNNDIWDESDYTLQLTGSIQEYRVWDNAIQDESIINHALSTTSYNSNTPSGSFDDLQYRLPLGTDTMQYNHTTQSILSSQHPASGSQLNNTKIATFSNFVDDYNYNIEREDYVFSYPDIASNRTLSNKVRLEDNSLFKNLDVKSRSELSAFDTQPIDDNKVGVYFSPSSEINEDISEHMAGVNIDNFIADEASEFTNEYSQLTSIRNYYFKQYYGNYKVQDFINSVEHYFPSLFKYIKQITPARTNKLTGVNIEPHVLNRSKISPLNNSITVSNTYIEGLLDAQTTYTFDNERENINATLYNDELSFNGNFNDLSGSIEQRDKYVSTSMSLQNIKATTDIQTNIEQPRPSETLKIVNPAYGMLGELQYIPANINDFNRISIDLIYNGSKISSPGFNINSDDTPDGKPVVEIFDSNENSLIGGVNSVDGQLDVQ